MTSKESMSEIRDEALSILNDIKAHQSVHKQQLDNYKEIVEMSVQFNRERMELFEKRWNGLKGIVIILVSIFMLSFVSDKIALINRPTTDEVQEMLDKTQKVVEDDYVKTERLFRGLGVIIDDNYGILEDKEVITHDEADDLIEDTQDAVVKEIDPEHKTRSVKKQ